MNGQLQQLLEKYAANSITAAEQETFQQLLATLSDADYQSALDAYEGMVQAQPAAVPDPALIQKIAGRIAAHERQQQAKRRHLWPMVAIAAAIFAGMIIVTYVLRPAKTPEAPIAAGPILPGG